MSNNNYLKLNGNPSSVNQDTASENMLYSIIDYYKWAFLEIGAYQNISRSPAVSGVFGGQKFRLGYVDDPRFTTGTVWQGYKGEWVWESGVSFNPQPTGVTVWLNSVQVPASSYYVDYPRGRVVFTTPSPTGSTVEANFSHRTVSFVKTEEPWFRELMYNSNNVNKQEFLNSLSGGSWNKLGETRTELPVVGVEIVGTSSYKPYQLGGGQWQYVDILYYIYTEDSSTRNRLRDLISNQNDKVIWLYNRDLMKQDSKWPFTLDYRGSPIQGYWTYPSLVAEYNNYRYLNARFIDSYSTNIETGNKWLYGAVVRTKAEIINPYG